MAFSVFSKNIGLFCIGVAALSGCSDHGSSDKPVEQAAKEDIVVQVNDNILTKADMRRYFQISEEFVETLPPEKRRDAYNRLREERISYIPTYIDDMLLMDDALRLKVMTKDELDRKIDSMIANVAKRNGESPKDYLKSLGAQKEILLKSARKRILVSAYAEHQFQKDMTVSAETVSNYVALIQQEKKAAASTNAFILASLKRFAEDFKAGKVSFSDYATEYSDQPVDQGEVLRTDFIGESELADEIFMLGEKKISRIIEEPDHYYILYVKKIIPAVRDADGGISESEKRHLLKLTKNKADYPVEMSFEEAEKELRYQFLVKAIQRRIHELKTNGVHKITWPNGTNTWKTVFAPEPTQSTAP